MIAWPKRDPAALTRERGVLIRLRHALAAIEGSRGLSDADRVSLGAAPVDAVLGGGLPRGAIHEIAARETEMAAATGFALALAARTAGPVLWVAEDMAFCESGVPYGPGLEDLGLAPERMITVAAAKPPEVFWAVEAALQCSGIAAVIGEVRSRRIDLTITRRLSLAAGRRNGFGLLLRNSPNHEASAAATRWIVKPAPPTEPMNAGPGPPRFAVVLIRNRWGQPGSWMLEWNCVGRQFDLTSAHREPLAQPTFDRPRPAA